MGVDPFRDDVLAGAGLDDRTSSGEYLHQAEELVADAVGAEHAFFSTCGSSLSVKAAMLAVAGHDGHLILSRECAQIGGGVDDLLWPSTVRGAAAMGREAPHRSRRQPGGRFPRLGWPRVGGHD
jgi:Orn/Lys/Arg decarboxylase, major domain